MSVVSLPMYDLAEVRTATLVLLHALADELTDAGWPAHAHAGPFDDHAALLDHWLDPSTALSQSCGLPYREALVGQVTVVGTFRWSGVVDDQGCYRSQVVARDDAAWPPAGDRPIRPVVNDPGSLSGWCSLGVALGEIGVGTGTGSEIGTGQRPAVAPLIVSGAHVGSLELLRRGEADVASIDAATYRLLERHRPSVLHGLRVVGLGPRVAATPLVTRVDPPIGIDAVRHCVRRALRCPSAAGACETLGIDGFVDLDDHDYAAVEELAARAELRLPRTGRWTGTGLRTSPAGP